MQEKGDGVMPFLVGSRDPVYDVLVLFEVPVAVFH
jgi:hypothetical protein